MIKKRSLIIGPGGLRGAYDAGVAAELCRQLGPEYFNDLYGCSGGAYAITFFVANQHDVIENVWRNYVDGRKFVHLLKPLNGRHILDLEYLGNLFRDGEMSLNVESVFQSSARLTYVLTDQRTGGPVYVRPTQANVFDLMQASSAMPFVHPSMVIAGSTYIDGVLSDPLPFTKALADGHGEVIVIYNKPQGFFVSDMYDTFSKMFASWLPGHTAHLLKKLKTHFQEIEQQLENQKELKIIRPKIQLPLKSILDTNKARLNACVDMGIADAKEFLKTYNST